GLGRHVDRIALRILHRPLLLLRRVLRRRQKIEHLGRQSSSREKEERSHRQQQRTNVDSIHQPILLCSTRAWPLSQRRTGHWRRSVAVEPRVRSSPPRRYSRQPIRGLVRRRGETEE